MRLTLRSLMPWAGPRPGRHDDDPGAAATTPRAPAFGPSELTIVHAACVKWAGMFAAISDPSEPTFTPEVLYDFGYHLGRDGYWTALIVVRPNGTIRLVPISAWPTGDGRFTGATRPRDGSQVRMVTAPDADVVRVELAARPLPFGSSAASIGVELDRGVAQDASIPAGRYLTMHESLAAVDKATRDSVVTSWMDTSTKGQTVHLLPPGVGHNQPRGFGMTGPAPDEGAIALRDQVRREVEAAFGILGLLSPEAADRVQELHRVAVVSTFNPLLQMLEAEATTKLERPVRFDRSAWYTPTFDAQARAVQRFVASGFERDEALRLAGLRP